jgi:uncharacterized protein YlxW (UPF0749 family)
VGARKQKKTAQIVRIQLDVVTVDARMVEVDGDGVKLGVKDDNGGSDSVKFGVAVFSLDFCQLLGLNPEK